MSRLFRMLPLLMLLAAAPACALEGGYSGAWYNPSQSGHGIFLEVLAPDHALFTWYAYDNQGHQAWILADGTATGNRVDAQAVITEGMRFGSFNPNDVQRIPWGTASLVFSSCTQATLSWQSSDPAYGSGSVPLTRLTSIDGLDCGKRPGSGLYEGVVYSSANGVIPVEGVLDEAGSMWLIQEDLGAIFYGAYSGTDDALSFSATGYAAPGYTFADGNTVTSFSGSGQVHERDWLKGGYAGGGDQGTLSLLYSNRYSRPSSTNAVAGSYTGAVGNVTLHIQVAVSGAISGSDSSGCSYQGVIQPVDTQFNAYSVALTVGNCGALSDAYDGIAFLKDYTTAGDNEMLVFGGKGRTNRIAIASGLVR